MNYLPDNPKDIIWAIIICVVVFIGALGGLQFLNAIDQRNAPSPTQSTFLSATVIYADNYSSGGGLLRGAQEHDLTKIRVSDGTVLGLNFSCNYYTNGMNLTVEKVITYPNAYGYLQGNGQPSNATGTTTFQSTTTAYYATNPFQALVGKANSSIVTSQTVITFSFYLVNYIIEGVPSGC